MDKNDNIAISIEDKAKLLRETVFPSIEVDLSDILDFIYPRSLEIENRLSIDEIYAAYVRTKPDKAPGTNNIPNRIVHILAKSRITLLERLF